MKKGTIIAITGIVASLSALSCKQAPQDVKVKTNDTIKVDSVKADTLKVDSVKAVK